MMIFLRNSVAVSLKWRWFFASFPILGTLFQALPIQKGTGLYDFVDECFRDTICMFKWEGARFSVAFLLMRGWLWRKDAIGIRDRGWQEELVADVRTFHRCFTDPVIYNYEILNVPTDAYIFGPNFHSWSNCMYCTTVNPRLSGEKWRI